MCYSLVSSADADADAELLGLWLVHVQLTHAALSCLQPQPQLTALNLAQPTTWTGGEVNGARLFTMAPHWTGPQAGLRLRGLTSADWSEGTLAAVSCQLMATAAVQWGLTGSGPS